MKLSNYTKYYGKIKLIPKGLVLSLCGIFISWKETEDHSWQRKQREVMWREVLSHLISQYFAEMTAIIRIYEKVEVQRGEVTCWN